MRFFAIALWALVLVSGCGPQRLVPGEPVDGTITTDDERDVDSNEETFYYDLYSIGGEAGTTFEIEITARNGDPIWFKLKALDVEVFSEYGTQTAQFVTPAGEEYICSVYLRSDFVKTGAPYRLTLRRP